MQVWLFPFLSEPAVTNRSLKKMLIKRFADTICFTYPRNRRQSQMFFSAEIAPSDVVETLRSTDAVKVCAAELRKECENDDFGLDSSYCDAADLQISMDMHRKNRSSWKNFFSVLFPYRRKSENIEREK